MELINYLSKYIVFILILYGIIGFLFSLKYTKKENRDELFENKDAKKITRWVTALILGLLFLILSLPPLHLLWIYPLLLLLLSFTSFSYDLSFFVFCLPIIKLFHEKDMKKEFFNSSFGKTLYNPNDYFNKGERSLEAGNIKKAIKYFNKFIKDNPTDFRPYSAIGYCFRHLIPLNAGLVNGDPNLYRYMRKIDLSIKYYEKSIQILIENHIQIDNDFQLINFDLNKITEIYLTKLTIYNKFKVEHPFNNLVKPLSFNDTLLASLSANTGSNFEYDKRINDIKMVRGYYDRNSFR